jgi:AcrR family transcriptional regulator
MDRSSDDVRDTGIRDDNENWRSFLSSIATKHADEVGERKQERSKRREQEILRAAIRVFARDGISRARIGDVASEAGMPVSSIYEYYPSKEDLAYAVPLTQLSRFFAEYTEAVADKTTYGERLRFYLWLAADFARRNPEWARTLYLEVWPSVLINESSVRHSLDDYVRIIIDLIRRGEQAGEWPAGPDPYETAAIFNGSVNQIIITWLLYRKPRNLMKAVGSVVDRTMTLLNPSITRTPLSTPKFNRRKGGVHLILEMSLRETLSAASAMWATVGLQRLRA